jgi:hypothetical protein
VFDIQLVGRPEGKGDDLFIWGRLTLGTLHEEFQAPLYEWAPGDYAAHWLESAQRILAGSPVAVFLTHMVRPDAPYHIGWPAWQVGDRVYVQERLFVREQLTGPFDPEFPEVHVGPRQGVSGEGHPVAEWEIALRDLAAFVERRRGSQVPA